MQKHAIFIMGPTAAGKTALAIELAQRLPCDIISVDSAMVYRGMNVGTGKPHPEILAKVPHKLVDILEPTEIYSVGRFCQDAYTAMENSVQQGRIPVLVGGTMMYFWALQHGLAELPAADQELRAKIASDAQQCSWPELHAKLQALDPIAAAKIEPNDAQRIQRALEVVTISGKPLSSYVATKSLLVDWQLTHFILAPVERSELHQLIATRFKQMLADGLVAEVAELCAEHDLSPELPALRAVGYRQAWEFLQGRITEQELFDKGIAATRQLAKRQFTWLRRWPVATNLNSGVITGCAEILRTIKLIN